MASVIQKNGIKPLTNGGLIQHVDMNKVCASRQMQQQQMHMQHTQQDQGQAQQAIVNGQQVLVPHGHLIGHAPNQNVGMAVGQNSNLNASENSEVNQHELFENEVAVPQSADVEPEVESEPEIDIVINNVVCSFSVRCHLNLRQIALTGFNVEYRRENGVLDRREIQISVDLHERFYTKDRSLFIKSMVTMKLRRPYTTASIWSSGKITCTGATSEDQAKVAARRFARCLQKLGFKTRFNNFRVVNVLGTCSMPFAIKITAFSERHKEADYEPELHPGVTYKLKKPKATLKIFSTGSVTVTAPCVASVQAAIEYIFPLVYEFRKERTKEDILALKRKMQERRGKRHKEEFDDEALLFHEVEEEEEEEEMEDEDEVDVQEGDWD